MSSELRNAVALWSDPSPPNDFCHYDHCSANVPFGTMRIEWKSWKDYPGYCLYFDAGETFIGSFDSLDQAKSHAAAIIEQDREAVRAEIARAIEVELSMCAIANVEAPSEWIDGFEFAWKRVKEALRQYKEATNV